ncbi:MAG TPA: X-Pro dipeptidase, partial [Alteromonas macleodii]|nr:X-Pro dipeptidase [Alteromonas macleodii]
MGKIIGTKTPQQALDSLVNMTGDLRPIELSEYNARIAKAQHYMQENGIGALYLNAGTN